MDPTVLCAFSSGVCSAECVAPATFVPSQGARLHGIESGSTVGVFSWLHGSSQRRGARLLRAGLGWQIAVHTRSSGAERERRAFWRAFFPSFLRHFFSQFFLFRGLTGSGGRFCVNCF